MNVDQDSEAETIDYNETYPGDPAANSDLDSENEGSTSDGQLPTESTFDLTLPATHSYLGQNLEELRGRTLLDDGIYFNLPLLVKQSVVLFPGQTLPMTVFNPKMIEMLQKCIDKNRTFGVVCLGFDKMVPIGTTAEIYEYMEGNQRMGFRIKAKGRQRFKVLRLIQGYDQISADVKVLPEVTLGPPLYDERLASLDHLRIKPTTAKETILRDRVDRMDAILTPWPAWVYKHYDPVRLSSKIRHYLQFIEKKGSSVPEDPTDLSFWVAQNFPLDDSERIILLNYNCAIPRLQRELNYLFEDKVFVCSNCRSRIAKQSDMFPMNKEGPQSAYCNSGGVIHETVTLYRAQGLLLSREAPTTEYSWFPGYAWTIAICKGCDAHMGWRFTAVESHLKPSAFWGLTRKSLKSIY